VSQRLVLCLNGEFPLALSGGVGGGIMAAALGLLRSSIAVT
jgi:hypothetical protein